MKKTKRILMEEDEPSQEAITKAAKKVKGMKSGKPVKMKKAKTDPSRNYAQEALKTGAKNAAIKNAASRAKPDRVKPSTERVYTSTEITKAKRDATKKRVGRGESSRRISNKEATILIRAREMTEYKRIGVSIAEAMGYRVDELAPVLAGLGAGVLGAGRVAAMGLRATGTAVARGGAALGRGVVQGTKAATTKAGQLGKAGATKAGEVGTAGAKKAGTMIKDKAVDMATEKAIDKAKEKLVGEGKTMNKFVKKLMEAHVADRNRKGTSDPTGFAYPIARESGATRSSKAIIDPGARRGAKKAKAKMEKKLKLKPGSTKPQAQHMVQVHLNDRLAKRKKREAAAAKKKGNRDTTPSIIPNATKEDDAADRKRDTWRRMAPGDK